jgi:hypothetical protein
MSVAEVLVQLRENGDFRRLVREEVEECLGRSEEREAKSKLDAVVQEIGGYIASITEFAIEEESSNRYYDLIKKNEQLYREFEKRVQA